MSLSVKLKSVDVDAARIADEYKNDDELGRFAAMEWHKLYLEYVPMRSGMLGRMVVYSPWKIKHNVPYASVQYHGKRFVHSKDRHPKASAEWDKAAAGVKSPQLARSIEAFLERRNGT